MGEFLGSAWWLLVSIGVLVTFHEFGHFWVARRCGVKVLRFSVGFGKPIWSRMGRDGTEYAIGAIPLGGYVKMLGEHSLEAGDIEREPTAAELAQSHDRQPVWKRIAIAAAGPLANLVLCVALLWAMFVIGRPDFQPVVGVSDGIAASSGLHAGDRLLSVDGRATPTWSEASMALLAAALDRRDAKLEIETADGVQAQRDLRLSQLPAGLSDDSAIAGIGLVPRHFLVPAVVGEVVAGTPATGVLEKGDRITAIDGQPVSSFEAIGPLVQALGERGGDAMVEVQRDGERLALPIRPAKRSEPGSDPRWALGIHSAPAPEPAYDAKLRYGPLRAVPAALGEAGSQTRQLFEMIARVFKGRVSVQNSVSGPITIAREANSFAGEGPAWFLYFLALLSLSLAIINLLPIPVLDGGHLLYYLIELAKGSPLSERAMVAGQYIGLAALAGLMGLAFYNDFLGLAR
ncbi:RIP metalloprotease RseP [Pseudoluteimonas lycopersici]|uniref:Zinc metalloprotease n=1 Tax=Pseudoluteimonas lycopersici TaxID=1324796 RepID=A0A516V409_9GAMM|nr:RIP metalloprotease RseP [Lysobacter lycopersici]QDQ73272.1 RIP metalloprotease RseP [Lysobacter lycopersici]